MFLGNTKVITQSALQRFQEEMGKALNDPYKVCNFLNIAKYETTVYLHVGCDEAQWTAYFTTAGKNQGMLSIVVYYVLYVLRSVCVCVYTVVACTIRCALRSADIMYHILNRYN